MFTWVTLVVYLTAVFLPAHLADRPVITSPLPGEALQGVVTITGSTDLSGFQSAEVAFSYQDGSNNWFVLAQDREEVDDGPLATWDTTTITDGAYSLRVQVRLESGDLVETIVSDLRVRNYSPVETNTPVPTGQAVSQPAERPTQVRAVATMPPQPTPLPANPAVVTQTELLASMARGVELVVAVFLLIGAYFGAKTFFRK